MNDLYGPEKGCKWNFASGMNFNIGPTDAAGLNFDGSWESLIRECIQNSLDAVLDVSAPVCVNLEFKKLPMSNYKNFFGLKNHIQACLDTFPSAAKQYRPMLEFFKIIDESRESDMGYLQISDYNTKGMSYNENDDSCDFSAFVRSLGVHGGDQNASGRGGSFGLGKSTIFKMSPFRTIFVSTYTKNNQYVFEGVASLTTHKMGGEKLSHIGYYDNREGNPITEECNIPSRFLRKENSDGIIDPGTDIYVMGRKEDKDDINDIIKSVLTHYWLSIYKNKLVVSLVDSEKHPIVLNKDNLDEYMIKYFRSPLDNAKNSLNPRPYYNAVAYVDSMPGATLIKKKLPLLGDVELYLCRNSEAKLDRIACFRLPCMMVMRKSVGQLRLNINSYGLYGAFVCVDNKGDLYLKQLENPAHDEWHEKHWREHLTNKIDRFAIRVMDELREFLAEEIVNFCKVEGKATLKMLGAGKYLYTIQDMVDSGDDNVDVNSENGVVASSNFTDEETGVRDVEVDNGVSVVTPTPPIGLRHGNVINMDGRASTSKPDDKPGNVTVLVTPPSKKKNKTKHKNVGGNKGVDGVDSDKEAATLVPVDFKIYAQWEGSVIVHNVCVITDRDVDSALIQFSSKREDGKNDTELEIVDFYGIGTFKDMELHNVPLRKGNNMLKVRFNDNTKHAFTINVKLQ